jgi:hypothetical protein
MARIVDFFDGAQSETTPTIGNIVASDLITYADDATYEANEQGSPAEGNLYFNTTSKLIRYYNGTAWINQVDTTSVQTLENKVIDGSSTGSNDVSTVSTKVEVTPTGNLAANDVQEALVELQGDIDLHETRLDDHDTDILDLQTNKENKSEKGAANGYCPLDGSGLIPSGNLPSFVDDVLEYANLAAFPVTGETGKIYIALNTNRQYRWSGSIYIDISGMVDSVNGQTGAVVLEIDDLDNVNISIPAPGQKLRYDGTNWVNIIDNINSLSDVDTNTVAPITTDVLTFNGTNWVPQAPSGGNISITTKTSAYTAAPADELILCNATSAAFTINLPTAVGISGKKYTVKKIDSSFNIITIDANSTQTIDGNLTRLLNTQNEQFTLVSDGSNWIILNRHIDQKISSYTPTFVGFGTVTNIECVWWREGKNIHGRGKFTAGTPTAVIASLSLPSAALNSENTPILPSIAVAGKYANEAGGAALGNKGGFTLVTPVVNVINFGDINLFGTSTSNTVLTAKLATTLVSSGDEIGFDFTVPIQNWEG